MEAKKQTYEYNETMISQPKSGGDIVEAFSDYYAQTLDRIQHERATKQRGRGTMIVRRARTWESALEMFKKFTMEFMNEQVKITEKRKKQFEKEGGLDVCSTVMFIEISNMPKRPFGEARLPKDLAEKIDEVALDGGALDTYAERFGYGVAADAYTAHNSNIAMMVLSLYDRKLKHKVDESYETTKAYK